MFVPEEQQNVEFYIEKVTSFYCPVIKLVAFEASQEKLNSHILA